MSYSVTRVNGHGQKPVAFLPTKEKAMIVAKVLSRRGRGCIVYVADTKNIDVNLRGEVELWFFWNGRLMSEAEVERMGR